MGGEMSGPFAGVGSTIGGMLRDSAVRQQDDPLISSAKNEFPILQKLQLGYKYNPSAQPGYLEFWPSGESGTPEWPRPKEFPLGTIGVEVYDPNTRPIDLMGDIASHFLVETDPLMQQYYSNFESSLTPKQQALLMQQYKYDNEHFGENRPYQDWYTDSGLPGLFRGYAFQQLPDANALYTPQQRNMFDNMMNYLRGR